MLWLFIDRTAIKDLPEGSNMAEAATENLLDCNNFKQFWTTWDNNRIQFGMGDIGEHLIVEYIDIPNMWDINGIGISTRNVGEGEWEILQEQGTPQFI